MTSSNVLYLAAGLTIGGVIGWLTTKKHYETLANAEVDEMRDYYRESMTDISRDPEKTVKVEISHSKGNYKPDLMDFYKNRIVENQRTETEEEEAELEQEEQEELIGEPEEDLRPFIIAPEEFIKLNSSDFGNDKATVTYFEEDGKLMDEDEELLDLGVIGGTSLLGNFGEYDDDVMYVRNNGRGIDYEVLLNHSSYKEYMGLPDEED